MTMLLHASALALATFVAPQDADSAAKAAAERARDASVVVRYTRTVDLTTRSSAAARGAADVVVQNTRTGEAPVNGVVTLHEPGSPFIAFNLWVRAGSQNDPEGKEGLAALTAALLGDGSTTEDSYQAILAALYPMAAGYGSSVDKEMTVFRGVIHRDNLEEYYRLLSNAVLKPAFAEADFERVKSRVVNYLERARRYSRDEELTKELLFWMAYEGTPYEHPEEGYVQSVKALTLDDVRGFYDRHYASNNVVVGVGGGYPEGFPERVRADFDAALPTRDIARVPAPEPRVPDGVRVLLVEKDTDASPISIGFPLDVLRGDDDFFPLMLANSWLGEHRNSFGRLYQAIREARGMNYGDYSYIEAFPLGYTTQQPPVNVSRRSQLFELWIRPISLTEPGNLHARTLFATRAALRELDRLSERGLPPEEVERTRNFLRDYAVNWGNTISRRLAYAMDDAFYGLERPFLESIRPGLEALTPEEVSRAVREHLRSDGYYMVVITRDAEAFKRKLLSGEPTPIGYAGEKSAELLAEDREIASFPIPVRAEDIRIIPIGEVFETGRRP